MPPVPAVPDSADRARPDAASRFCGLKKALSPFPDVYKDAAARGGRADLFPPLHVATQDWEAAFPGTVVPLCRIGGKCAGFRAKSVEVSGHLPLAWQAGTEYSKDMTAEEEECTCESSLLNEMS